MVIISKKIIGKEKYFYLEHSFRKDGKVKKTDLPRERNSKKH